MANRPLLIFSFILLAGQCYGQLSMIHPQICHNKSRYLTYYNDGLHQITFSKGNFKELRIDSTFIYSVIERSFTLYGKSSFPLSYDTLIIKQLPHSIMLSKGVENLEITDLQNMPSRLNDFWVGPYTDNSVVRGLSIGWDDKFIKIEIWTWGKTWHWNFVIKQNNQRLSVDYNGYRGNRFENIMFLEDTLQYGVVIAGKFAKPKKIRDLMSWYAPSDQRTGAESYSTIPMDISYRFKYNRRGKLIPKKVINKSLVSECN